MDLHHLTTTLVGCALPFSHYLILTMREPLSLVSRRTCLALRHTITGMLSDIFYLSLGECFTHTHLRKVFYCQTYNRLHFGYPYSLGLSIKVSWLAQPLVALSFPYLQFNYITTWFICQVFLLKNCKNFFFFVNFF